MCPGGNLGNSSAFGKALHELYTLGLIDRLQYPVIHLEHGRLLEGEATPA